MAKLGSFGDVVFEASEHAIRTFTELIQNKSTRYSTINVANGEQLLQYEGEELQTANFSISLHHRFSDPTAELTMLGKMVDDHKAHLLVVGEYKLGEFVLQNIRVVMKRVADNGVIMFAEVSLDLKEYK